VPLREVGCASAQREPAGHWQSGALWSVSVWTSDSDQAAAYTPRTGATGGHVCPVTVGRKLLRTYVDMVVRECDTRFTAYDK
jgi:hypothetical protein